MSPKQVIKFGGEITGTALAAESSHLWVAMSAQSGPSLAMLLRKNFTSECIVSGMQSRPSRLCSIGLHPRKSSLILTKTSVNQGELSEQVLVHTPGSYKTFTWHLRRGCATSDCDHSHLLHGTAQLLMLKETLGGARSARGGGVDGLKAVDQSL